MSESNDKNNIGGSSGSSTGHVTINFQPCERYIIEARKKFNLNPLDGKEPVLEDSLIKLQSMNKIMLALKAGGVKKQLRLMNPVLQNEVLKGCGAKLEKNQTALLCLAVTVLGSSMIDAVLERIVEESNYSSLSEVIASGNFDTLVLDQLVQAFPILDDILEIIRTFLAS